MKKQKFNLRSLDSRLTFNHFTFEIINQDEDDIFYECRGAVMYDDEHDEMPEPELWDAAHKLKKYLKELGINSNVSHSEKGWVEVQILNDGK